MTKAKASARFDVTALGETMLRFSVPPGERLEDAHSLEVTPGGSETNVCAALASLGRRCGWLSRLPEGSLGRLVLRRLQAARIDTSAVQLVPEARLGTYYVELATPPRAAQVIYDRAGAAFTQLTAAELDWDYLLDTRVLHLTGITPALSEGTAVLVREAMRRAKDAGVPVSFDVNFRRKLWSAAQARAVLTPLLPYVTILFCGAEDAAELFGLGGKPDAILRSLRDLSGATTVVLTLGSAGAAALDGQQVRSVEAHKVQVIDPLGAGDAFAAGVLDGYLDGSLGAGLERGSALAALALTQHGDMLITQRQEMEAVIRANSSDIHR